MLFSSGCWNLIQQPFLLGGEFFPRKWRDRYLTIFIKGSGLPAEVVFYTKFFGSLNLDLFVE